MIAMKTDINRNTTTSIKVAALLLLCGGGPLLQGQTVLSVDFGSSDPFQKTESPVQSGFEEFLISNVATSGPLFQTYGGLNKTWTSNGSVTITIASGTTLEGTGNILSRDRDATAADSAAFTYSSLYRDIMITSSSANMRIGISGLNPDAIYDVRVFAYDNNAGASMTFANATGTGSESGTITWTATYAFDGANTNENTIYSTVLRIQANGNGEILLSGLRSNSWEEAIINGLEIIAIPPGPAIPEPAISGLLLAATGILLASLRPRRSQGRNTSNKTS
jgi:hypothetical protein